MNLNFPDEHTLELMVLDEFDQRTSTIYAELCTQVKDIPNGWLNVTTDMQKNIVMKFGYTDEMEFDIALNMLRRANIIYPHNKIFQQVPIQVRNNKATKGELLVEMKIPNPDVYDLDGQPYKLSDFISSHKPNLIFFSSAT